ncbi:hypothetical protein WN943_015912 [Citrus x changshan-huyou]
MGIKSFPMDYGIMGLLDKMKLSPHFSEKVEGMVLTGSLLSLTPFSLYHPRQIPLGYFKWSLPIYREFNKLLLAHVELIAFSLIDSKFYESSPSLDEFYRFMEFSSSPNEFSPSSHLD